MVFSKKWPRNHPKILLHFLIHIDVLKLCSKFEVIPTSIFKVTAIIKSSKYYSIHPVLQYTVIQQYILIQYTVIQYTVIQYIIIQYTVDINTVIQYVYYYYC